MPAQRRAKKATKKQQAQSPRSLPDDVVSVARRLGADEDKERFEAKLKKIAQAKASK